jgi:1,2-dihydroxy-3-keto-5-methylthiopentene dioxygenase
MEAWLMAETSGDQRDENRRSPNAPVSFEELADIGVWAYHMDPATMLVAGENGELSALDALAKEMRFINRDEVCCSPDHLPEYDTKLRHFFTEHIHEDDEIRLVKAGSGFFDVRNARDEWVRIWVKPGNLIIIPAGIYHRFTMDRANFTHAIRLFAEVPKWTPINRPCDENAMRLAYMAAFHGAAGPRRATVAGPADGRDNVFVQHPSRFDDTLRPLVRAVAETNGRDALVLYVTSAEMPGTGHGWCPDCVAADPIVAREVARVRALWAPKGRRLVFVQASVTRASYKGNAAYPYRSHPFIKMTNGIPTLLLVAGTEDESFVKQRCDGEVPANWALKDE